MREEVIMEFSFRDDCYCPNCLTAGLSSSLVIFSDLEYHCNICDNWSGLGKDALTYEQVMNIKRSDVLKSIL